MHFCAQKGLSWKSLFNFIALCVATNCFHMVISVDIDPHPGPQGLGTKLSWLHRTDVTGFKRKIQFIVWQTFLIKN
jgi:hypothetical protein